MGKRHRGECPVCKNHVHITRQGRVAGHRVEVNEGYYTTLKTCNGVGMTERARVPR